VSPDDKTPPPQPPRRPPGPPPLKPPANPVDNQALAERRMREEMARQRRQEEQHLKALKVGCISIIAVTILAMVIAFMF
jgi:hypothetical protein